MKATTLIAFFKGTAGEFNKLRDLAPIFMSQAAEMRKTYSPYRLEVIHENLLPEDGEPEETTYPEDNA